MKLLQLTENRPAAVGFVTQPSGAITTFPNAIRIYATRVCTYIYEILLTCTCKSTECKTNVVHIVKKR
jgi:hypothetical protein